MTATFGRLQQQTLELHEGLNILQAPNEAGKSTWCAFLSAMLYGINSRERDRAGSLAEKNRYAPWSGAPMQGRLDCQHGSSELTLLRQTNRQGAPFGDFRGIYAGTGNEVPGLNSQNCGEMLLGVSREVFERSALIRQGGLPIGQDAGLERRIAALITAGEEDVSYSEAAERLKKQLNRRRHNKTGQLPALESELEALRKQLSDTAQLEAQLCSALRHAEELAATETLLNEELASHQAWKNAQERQTLIEAEAAARQAAQHAEALRQRAAKERLPENETIGRLRGALVNLESTRKSLEKARKERDEAAKTLLRAEEAVAQSPFSGQTAESARAEALTPPTVYRSSWAELALFFLGLGISAAVCMLLVARVSLMEGAWRVLPWGVFVFLTAVNYSLTRLVRKHELQKSRTQLLIRRFGTADPAAIAALAEDYAKLLQTQQTAQTALNQRSASADTLYNTLFSNEQAILLEVRRFAPSAFDSAAADAALRECAQRRKALLEAEAAARNTALRYELLAQRIPKEPYAGTQDSHTPPTRSLAEIEAELEQTRTARSAAQSAADKLQGQLTAIGNPAVLSARAEALEAQIERLEEEYSSLSLALEALDQANTSLQNRFSPQLGREAARIFSELTAERYCGVTLDRSLHLSTESAEDSFYRDSQFLSAGAMDQLYLAVRLAICRLVLPQVPAVPLILDDALANFDDTRCAAALEWLRKEAQNRQILLFTCHSREAALLRGKPDIWFQELTESAHQV